MKAAIIILVTCVTLAAAGLFVMYRQARTLPAGPGATEFQAATEQLGATGAAALGNSAKAIELADRMRSIMESMRSKFFTGATSSRIAVYCRLNPDDCAFLIYMPGLYRYDAQAKQKLAEMAWVSAQPLFRHLSPQPRPARLAIGLRDGIPYDVVWVGKVTNDPLLDAEAKHTGINCRTQLYPFFTAP